MKQYSLSKVFGNIAFAIKNALIFFVKFIVPGALILAIILALILRIFFLSFVDKHELGYCYNKITGEIVKFERTGYFLFPPWFYSVHSIDLRPMQLQITANSFGNTSAMDMVNQRVLNAKLVSFNPDGLETFIEWHGRNAGDRRTELAEILRCYAFDREGGKNCPFLTIERELSPAQTPDKETDE
ncbi:MAG: hypothetical protein WC119_00305 [Synergistaceae bacterium]